MINIIYASTSGNVEAVCDFVAQTLREEDLNVQLSRAEQTNISIIQNNKYFVLATSTWEHGELNPFFKTLYNELATIDLKDKYFAFIGLGDRRYEPVLFCNGIEILKNTVLKDQVIEIGDTLKINGEPYEHLETIVKVWAKDIAAKFLNLINAK